MPVTDGDSPYTKVVSLYNSGNPPTLSILDTTDVIALAEEKAADLSNEAWTGEAEEYLTKINGKVYSFPLCIEGRGIIYNKSVIEDTLGTCLLYTSQEKICQQRRKNRKEPKGGKNNGNGCKNSNPRTENSTWH